MKKAVLYARVSSALQEKERTIESQIAELRKQIRASGDVLTKEYIDDGFSGALLDRPAMNELRKDLKANAFQSIYILNTDRIARDVTYQNIIIGEFLQSKKQIIINGKDYINNPENKFTLTILGAVAELERAKTIERTRRGSQHRLKQGYLLSHGNKIFGYTYYPRTTDSFPSYEINEHEAKIVRYIFETYASGSIGLKSLARLLKQTNFIKDERNKLGDGHLKYILKNESYTGIKYFNTMTDTNAISNLSHRTKRGKKIHRERSEWVGIKIPKIIPKKLFDKVQARFKYNFECFRNANRTQLLSNLVVCGICKLKCYAYRRYYKVQRRTGLMLYQKAVYRCKTKGIYHNPEIDTRVLDSSVLEIINDLLGDPKKLMDHIEALNNTGDLNKTKLTRDLKDIEKEIRTIGKQKERIIDLYSLGDLKREEYVKRITSYESEMVSLQEKHVELVQHLPLFQTPKIIEKSVVKFCRKTKIKFNELEDFDSRRKFLLEFLTKVEYHRNEKGDDYIRLFGTIPVQVTDKDEVNIEFAMTQTINRVEVLAKARELNLDNENIGGSEIMKMEYGKLVTKAL